MIPLRSVRNARCHDAVRSSTAFAFVRPLRPVGHIGAGGDDVSESRAAADCWSRSAAPAYPVLSRLDMQRPSVKAVGSCCRRRRDRPAGTAPRLSSGTRETFSRRELTWRGARLPAQATRGIVARRRRDAAAAYCPGWRRSLRAWRALLQASRSGGGKARYCVAAGGPVIHLMSGVAGEYRGKPDHDVIGACSQPELAITGSCAIAIATSDIPLQAATGRGSDQLSGTDVHY